METRELTYEALLYSETAESQLHEKKGAIIQSFRPAHLVAGQFAPVIFLLDYSNRKYIYVDEGCSGLLGYTANYFLVTGLEEYLSKWHRADFDVINKEVFPDIMNFLRNLKPDEYKDYIFSYNYRMKNADDRYNTVLQRFSYIPGKDSAKPAGIIGVIFDITHFKNDTSLVHTIERAVEHKNGIVHELVFKRIHPVYGIETRHLLSKREIQILVMIAEGLSSKQIAFKTELSINTVNNHRKSMLAKLQCKTSSELTNYAVKHGLV
jgi:DNA-binding CsgD family transcriptional regulator